MTPLDAAITLTAAALLLTGCDPLIQHQPNTSAHSTVPSFTITTTTDPPPPVVTPPPLPLTLPPAPSSGPTSGPTRPDRHLTPGAVMTTDLAIICGTSTTTRRNVSAATKAAVYAEYGLTTHIGYVVDHLIPLEAGGANTLPNLWPQRIADAHAKDGLEARAHAAICTHHIPAAQVQADIAANWVSALKRY